MITALARIRNFDGEYFPEAMLLDGRVIEDGPVGMENKTYKSLGQCDLTGLCVIQDMENGKILIVSSVDLEWEIE